MIDLFRVFMSEKAPDEVGKTLMSGFITQGPKVELLEQELHALLQHPYILTLNSATSGLTLALRLLESADPSQNWPGLDKSKDVILTTPLTCTATNWAILANGYNIQWVDVDTETCNMSLDDLEARIGPHTKVIYVVHWGGTPVDLDALNAILDRKEAELGFRPRVVEDCAHGFLSKFDGRPLGTHGNIAVYSLQAIKHLTTGDGGIIMLPTEHLYERAKLLRWFGINRDKRNFKYKDFRMEHDIPEWGYKMHMNDLNATVGLCNIREVERTVAKHKEHAARYMEALSGLSHVTLIPVHPKSDSAFWVFTIMCNDAERFIEFMKERDVSCSQVHKRNDGHSCVSQYQRTLPGLDSIQDKYVAVPVGWWLKDEDVQHVITCIREYDAFVTTGIRRVVKADYDRGFLDVLNAAFTRHRDGEKPSFNDFAQQLALADKQEGVIFVYEDGGMIVGTAKALIEYKLHNNFAKMGHIEDVAVHENYRGKGIGSKLVKRCLQECNARGSYKVVLDCNESLCSTFYEPLGFVRSNVGLVKYN